MTCKHCHRGIHYHRGGGVPRFDWRDRATGDMRCGSNHGRSHVPDLQNRTSLERWLAS